MLINVRNMGRPNGKLAGRIWTRASTSSTIYSYIPGIKPKWRTEPQLRTMAALASAPHAWRRLDPATRRMWQESPPPVQLKRRNSGANPQAATGWNKFVSKYIQEARPMVYMSAVNNQIVTVPFAVSRTVAALQVPTGAPTNILLRIAATAGPQTVGTSTECVFSLWGLWLPDTWTELFQSTPLTITSSPLGFAVTIRPAYAAAGTAPPVYISLVPRSTVGVSLVGPSSLEMLY